ncbi:MAG: hypothetical protein R3351_06975 [Nitrospirales bacterium]|nr:hypothetical protein [Nitrospirales bacterium]
MVGVNTILILDLKAPFTPPFHVEVIEGPDLGSSKDHFEALETQVDSPVEEKATLLQELNGVGQDLENQSFNYWPGKSQGQN